ncbi:hypothetical protein F5887DRAFT_1102295 [Amanita rubescens]|nr:hypothetical protein F5887DRAFT_1102295 [Amanita rubescens]
MGPSSKSSSPDSASSGPDDDLENETSDSESSHRVEDDSQSEEAIDSDESSEEEDDEDSANTSAKITGKKRKRQEAEGEPIEEEKVLSHAEKRRQMKREQQKLKAQESKTQKRKKSAGADVSAASSNAKRQNSVWVGNLSYKTTVDDLKAFFADAGEVTRINMPIKVLPGPGRKFENRGFAYVDFAAPEAQTRAIALSEQHLIGRKLLIKDGDNFAGRPQPAGSSNATGDSAPKTHSKTAQKILKVQKQPPGPTLFLGNLGFETTEADIIEMLAAHRFPSPGKKQSNQPKEGKTEEKAKGGSKEPSSAQSNSWIRKVRMGTFEDSGLCKGFAFVDFVGTEDATAALTNPKNYSLNGRKLVVEYASPDAVRRGAPKGSGSASKLADGKTMGKRPRPLRKDDEMEKQKAPAKVEGESPDRSPKRQRVDKPDPRTPKPGKREYKGRSKPGAALASAQRESVAIIPSQGKKIKFD